MVISPFENFACPARTAVTTLIPECRQVQFKSDLANTRAGGYVEAREVKSPTVLASLENDIGGAFVQSYELRLTSDANGRAQWRFRLRPVQGEATAMLVHAPNTPSRFVSRP